MGKTRRIVAATFFRIIQIILLPLGAIAYVLFIVKLGTRRDELCARLMMVMPNVPYLGLLLETAPTLVAHRLTGYVPRIYQLPQGEGVAFMPAGIGNFYGAVIYTLGGYIL